MAQPPKSQTKIPRILAGALALALSLLLAACTQTATAPAAPASTAPTAPVASSPTATPAANCLQAALTVTQTEGPYFKAGAPQRDSLLEPGMAGAQDCS